jgi:tetratricopeptide (TPR) repeat protein
MEENKNHIDQTLFEKIEAYLLGSMNPAEKTAFEQRIENDPDLKAEVELQQKLMATVEVGAFLKEKSAGPAAVKQMPASETGKTRSLFRPWMAAAAVVFFVALWFLNRPGTDPQSLAIQYFQPDPGLPVTMSSSQNYQFYDGMVSYKEADYKKALKIWKELSATNAPSDTLRYYMGIAYLSQDEYNEAIRQLLPVAEKSGRWKHKSAWYLSLAYLRLNKVSEAIKWLQTIPNNPDATKLLKRLKKSDDR